MKGSQPVQGHRAPALDHSQMLLQLTEAVS